MSKQTADKLQITELLYRYAELISAGDFDGGSGPQGVSIRPIGDVSAHLTVDPKAFIHEGVGGYPLLLLHGYPETKRIWWRNISALAEAGYEVIAPDLRSRVHEPRRARRAARSRTLPPVGARRPVQPAGHRVFRRRARSPRAIGRGRP